ncbi:RND family efflux transporter MFP subunit [Xanthomonas arboricola]
MSRIKRCHIVIAVTAVAIFVSLIVIGRERQAPAAKEGAAVLSVELARAVNASIPQQVVATGNVAAWQESSVGTEANGLQLVEVAVNVGDVVRRGQMLARLNVDVLEADLAEARAAISQVEAEALDATQNLQRAEGLESSGAISRQQFTQLVALQKSASARVDAAKAATRRAQARLLQTRIVAPSDGVITSRTATVGAVLPAGQELFRLITDGRLEWRALVAASDMPHLRTGQTVAIEQEAMPVIHGTLRALAPTIDVQTHRGLAYVDLPANTELRAGAFVRGHVQTGNTSALTLPQSAILLRDGFSYVMRVDSTSSVVLKKVFTGQQINGRIEVTEGLSEGDAVIASGLAFLGEGDRVRVVDATARRGTDSRKRLPASAGEAGAIHRIAP